MGGSFVPTVEFEILQIHTVNRKLKICLLSLVFQTQNSRKRQFDFCGNYVTQAHLMSFPARMAVLSAFSIPTYNVYSMIALSSYTGRNKEAAAVLKSLVANPLTIGVIAGLTVLLVRTAQLQLSGGAVFSVRLHHFPDSLHADGRGTAEGIKECKNPTDRGQPGFA